MTRAFFLNAVLAIVMSMNSACHKKQPNWSADAPADPATLQPETICDKVAAYAGLEAVLVKMIVRSDATLNFEKGFFEYDAPNYVDYVFSMPAQTPIRDPDDKTNNEPISEEEWSNRLKLITDTDDPYRQITISIGRIGGISKSQKWDFDIRDMTVTSVKKKDEKAEGIRPPKSFKQIWEMALKEGAPENALATIEYDARGYAFNIVELIKTVSQYDSKMTKDTIFSMRLDNELNIIHKKTR